MDRLDKFLVDKNIVKSRSQAQHWIRLGAVLVNGKIITKTGFKVSAEDLIEIKAELNQVGRGALKLKGALDQFLINIQSRVVVDIGASTGGFTQVCLDRGAQKVYAIDVGRDQLAKELRDNKNVINLEGINIRYPLEIDDKADIAVVDLSFISLRLTLEVILSLLKESADIILLFKPQFEVGREYIGKGGLVKSSAIAEKSLQEFVEYCEQEHDLILKNQMLCPIKGKDGNQEFLLHLVFNR